MQVTSTEGTEKTEPELQHDKAWTLLSSLGGEDSTTDGPRLRQFESTQLQRNETRSAEMLVERCICWSWRLQAHGSYGSMVCQLMPMTDLSL